MQVKELSIPGPFRSVPAVLYSSSQRGNAISPALVYFHGGGFAQGTHHSDAEQMKAIADHWGGSVISADYVHTPEHVFPDAVNESAAVLQWLHLHGSAFGIDTSMLSCGGYSAGASIGFGALARLAFPGWLKAVVSIAGALNGDPTTPSMQKHGTDGTYPSQEDVASMFFAYTGVPNPQSAQCNVLNADLSCMPPTFIAAAETDSLRDASVALQRRLVGQGIRNEFRIYPAMSHLDFSEKPDAPQVVQCIRDLASFLQTYNPPPSASRVRSHP